MFPLKPRPTKPAVAPPVTPAAASTPNATVKEVAIEPAQAKHYAEMANAVEQARQNADKIVQMAAQPLIAIAMSMLLGKGVAPNANVVGIGGTPDAPTLKYIEHPAPQAQ